MATFAFTPSEPRTRDEIIAQIREVHRGSTAFWDSFSSEAFFAPVGNGWSPAGNVRHLNKSMKPLARALGSQHADCGFAWSAAFLPDLDGDGWEEVAVSNVRGPCGSDAVGSVTIHDGRSLRLVGRIQAP